MKKLVGAIVPAMFISLVAAVLGFSLILMFRHEWLYVTAPTICEGGTRLEIVNRSPVPGEVVPEASCIGNGSQTVVAAQVAVGDLVAGHSHLDIEENNLK